MKEHRGRSAPRDKGVKEAATQGLWAQTNRQEASDSLSGRVLRIGKNSYGWGYGQVIYVPNRTYIYIYIFFFFESRHSNSCRASSQAPLSVACSTDEFES